MQTVAGNGNERGLFIQGKVCLAAAKPCQQSEAQLPGSGHGFSQLHTATTSACPVARQAVHIDIFAALNACSAVLAPDHASAAVQELAAKGSKPVQW